MSDKFTPEEIDLSLSPVAEVIVKRINDSINGIISDLATVQAQALTMWGCAHQDVVLFYRKAAAAAREVGREGSAILFDACADRIQKKLDKLNAEQQAAALPRLRIVQAADGASGGEADPHAGSVTTPS